MKPPGKSHGLPSPLVCAGYLAHGTATDYMYERLGVPLSFTWEIYGDTNAHFNDCFRMFNPVTQMQFDEARLLLSRKCCSLVESYRAVRKRSCDSRRQVHTVLLRFLPTPLSA